MLETLKRYKLIIFIFAVVAVFLIALFNVMWADKLELMAYDFRTKFRMKPASPEIVTVIIDASTLEYVAEKVEDGFGKYPWPRTVVSKVVKYINSGNPKAIVLDLNVDGRTNYTKEQFSDIKFTEDLRNINNLFIAQKIRINYNHLLEKALQDFETNINYSKIPGNAASSKSKIINKLIDLRAKQFFQNGPKDLLDKHYFVIDDKTLGYNEKQNILKYYNLPKFLDELYVHTKKIGINLSNPDSDKIIRSYQPIYKYNDKYLFSLPLAVTASIVNSYVNITLLPDKLVLGDKKINLNKDLRFFINWRSKSTLISKDYEIPSDMRYNAIPFYKVFYNKIFKVDKDIFKNKIVVIGSTASSLKDLHKVPNSESYHGVEIISTIIDNLINDTNFIKKASNLTNNAIIILLCALGLATFILLRFKFSAHYITFYSLILFIALLYFIINLVLFIKYSYWLDLIRPEFIFIITMGSLVAITSYIDKDKRSQVENTFSKYVSPQVYQTLLSDYGNVSLTANRCEITVLFSDIRGFTPFSEELYPEQVAKYLNEYFTAMVKVILKHNGTVDKFMGDAIMAFFGAPLPDKDHALNAIKAGLEMIETLEKLNEKWSQIGRKNLDIGIGINTGPALVGNFGSDELMDFTVIGDTVNLGSRLESLNKQENTNILISAFTYQQVKDKINVNVLGPRTVKGKSESVVVYEVVGLK